MPLANHVPEVDEGIVADGGHGQPVGEVVQRQAEVEVAKVLEEVQQIVGQPADGKADHHEDQHLDGLPLGVEVRRRLLHRRLADARPLADLQADHGVAEADDEQGHEELGGEGDAGGDALVEQLIVGGVDGLAAVQHLLVVLKAAGRLAADHRRGHNGVQHLDLGDGVEDGVRRCQNRRRRPDEGDEDALRDAVAHSPLQRFDQRLVAVDGDHRHAQH